MLDRPGDRQLKAVENAKDAKATGPGGIDRMEGWGYGMQEKQFVTRMSISSSKDSTSFL